jgi:predicted nucleotidyltransferase
MTEVRDILRLLAAADARFVVIGGVALQFHGSAYVTLDLDIAYERTRENAKRIATALHPLQPRPRGFPADVPFIFDAQTLMSAEVLTLGTTAGDLDLLATVKGVGSFDAIEASSEPVELQGFSVKILSIDGLIRAKRAAGRPKDEPGLIELEMLREAREAAGDL